MLASTAVLIICGSSYFSMLLGVLRSILVMRLIGPSSQGVRKIVDLLNKYLSNSHLGVLHGVNKQVPILLGQKDRAGAQQIEDVGVSWVVGLATVASLLMAVGGLLNPTGTRTTAIAIVIGAGSLLVSQTATVYRTMARAWGNFAALGLVGGVETVTTFIFTLGGAYRWGLNGAMGGTLLAACVSLLVLSALAPMRIRVSFDLPEGLRLARIGLPIAFVIFADITLRTIDQSVVGYYYREAYHFGLYSMATQIAGYLFAIPEAAGFVIWPKIMQAWGASDGDSAAMWRQIMLPTLVAGLFMPLLAGIAFVVLPPMVYMVLPKFSSATAAAQMLSLGAVFLALPMATNSLLIANNREWQVVLVKLAGAGVIALGSWAVVALRGGTLMGLAAAAAVGYAAAAGLSLWLVLPTYERSRPRLLKTVLILFGPFLWALLALKVSSRLGILLWGQLVMKPLLGVAPVLAASPALSWKFTAIRLAIFLIMMLPLLAYGDRKTHLLQEFRAMVRSWRTKRGADDGRDVDLAARDQ